MSNDSNELRNLPVSPRPSNPYQWQHSELKIMKAFRRMNTDRGYNEPKLRHETIQTPEGGEMYVAEVDVYLQWRVKRTVRGEPQNTIKAASLDVAEKATAYLMDMLHGTKHMGAKNTKHQLQSEQANIGMNSGDRSSTLPAANAVGCKKEEDKSASTAPEEVIQVVEDRNMLSQSTNTRELLSPFNPSHPTKEYPDSGVICRDFFYERLTFHPPKSDA